MTKDTITIDGDTYQKVEQHDPGNWGKGDGGSIGKLAVEIVLDRSGSMETVRDDTIGAFNAYIDKLAKDTPDAVVSLILFDTQGIDTLYSFKPVKDVPKLTQDTYVPRAGTPLYDAVGKAQADLSAAPGERKALVILTDGRENSSREWTADKLKALLTERQEKDGWLVIYLGANQDAWAVGQTMGMSFGNTMPYSTQNMAQTLDATSRATRSYASAATAQAGRQQASFTADERTAALDEDDKA